MAKNVEKRVPMVMDRLVFGVVVFVLSLIWAQYYMRIRLASIVFAASLSLLSLVIIAFFSRRKKIKAVLSALEKRKFDQVMTQLTFASPEQNLALLKQAFSRDYHAEIKTSLLLLSSAKSKPRAHDPLLDKVHESENTPSYVVAPCFSHEPLSPQDLTQVISASLKLAPARIYILTNTCAERTYALAQMLKTAKVIILEAKEVFALLDKYDCFPPITVAMEKPRNKGFRLFLHAALSRKRAKPYVIASVVLAVAAFFVPYTKLYLTFATLAAVLAFLSLLNLDFLKPKPPKLDL